MYKLPSSHQNLYPLPIKVEPVQTQLRASKRLIMIAFSFGFFCYFVFTAGYYTRGLQLQLGRLKFNAIQCHEKETKNRQFEAPFWADEKSSLFCESGWKFLQDEYIGFCYRAWHSEGIRLSRAKTFCREHHGNLVSIRSQAEDQFVYDVAHEVPGITKVWIGLQNMKGRRLWFDLTRAHTYGKAIYDLRKPLAYPAFTPYTNKPYTAKCIRCDVAGTDGAWYYVEGSETLDSGYRPDGFVCKKRIRRPKIVLTTQPNGDCEIGWVHNKQTRACYFLQNFTDPLVANAKLFTWDEAESDCKKRGAHLVSIHSKEELEFVKDLITSDIRNQLNDPEWDDGCGDHHSVWMGLRRVNGTRFNVDGSPNYFYRNPDPKNMPTRWWKFCNDITNTFPQSMLDEHAGGKHSRFVCKKNVNQRK